MVAAVIALHIFVCIALVIVVLLQRGKGAEVGAVFGGSSQTVFGASGAGGVLFRLTWTFAALFFLTSLYLAYASTQRISGSIFEGRSAAPVKAAPSSGTAPLTSSPVHAAPAAPATNPAAPAPSK